MSDHRNERRTPLARPTEERTAEQSTQEASGLHEGLSGVRPGPGPEVAREHDADEVLSRGAEERYDTPRRYDEEEDVESGESTLPADDSTLNIKI